ncbi:MAG: chiA4 [Cytophagaceae bacterium]|jgi:GH18 family chitinase|nr:chiA4 [Cytophagaceae bacterium]
MRGILLFIVLFCLNCINGVAQFRIVGYFPSWQGNVNTINYSKLTHINYSFILPTSTGGLNTGVMGNVSRFQTLVSKAHENNVKVSIAIGGWNNGDDLAFRQLASAASTRTAFVTNVMNFVKEYSLDGVDMDWEYPYDNPGNDNDNDEPANFALLMAELYDSLHTKNKLLTAAVVGQGSTADGVLSSVIDNIDWFNVMAYDDYGNDNHSTFAFANSALNLWLGKNVPKSKLVLGVPFYSIKPTTTSYANIVAQDNSAAYNDDYDDYRYNGIYTIEEKTDLANTKASGIMIWEISMDSSIPEYSLVNTIYNYAVSLGAIVTDVTEHDTRSTHELWCSQDFIFWSSVSALDGCFIEGYDLQGKKVLNLPIQAKEGAIPFPSDLKGMYVILLRERKTSTVLCKKNHSIF